MSRISAMTEATAPEETKPLLYQLRHAIGRVPNVYATIGHSPGSLQSLLAWNKAVGSGGLSVREIEQLNLHISELNGCRYCICAHATVGAHAGLTPEDVTKARVGTGATERENALLAFARRVVRTGGSRAGAELERLREAGVSDREVIDTLGLIALNTFRNAVNIVAQTEIDFPEVPHLPED